MTEKPTKEWLEEKASEFCGRLDQSDIQIAFRDTISAIYAEVWREASTVECPECVGYKVKGAEKGWQGRGEPAWSPCPRCEGTGRISIRADERRKVLEEVRNEWFHPDRDGCFEDWLAEQLGGE